MTLPGVEIIDDDLSADIGPQLALATPFVVSEVEFGPSAPISLRNLRDYRKFCGTRTADSAATYDWLDGYWNEGGGRAYLVPLRGPAAAAASHTVVDGVAAVAATITAKNKGAAGNRIGYRITTSGGNISFDIYRDGVLVESTGLVASVPAAAAVPLTWVTITDGPGVNPVAVGTTTSLAGGDDDFDGITNTEITAAFALCPKELGPGINITPGRTTTQAISIAAADGALKNRLARGDWPDVSSATTIASFLTTLRADANADIIDVLGPRLNEPGLTSGTSRSAPASALACAAEARNDRAGISPNQPAAGRWAVARYFTSETITWSDDDRETINDAGGRLVRTVDRQLKVYGSRTVADPASNPAAIRIGSARLRQAIKELARFQAEQTEFDEIDQGGVELGNLKGRIRSAISTYQRSLYFLDVTAEVVEDDTQPGIYLVEVGVTFQAAPDAERVKVTITRQVTEV